MLIPSSRAKKSRKIGLFDISHNCQPVLQCNIPEQQRPQLHLGRTLKSHNGKCIYNWGQWCRVGKPAGIPGVWADMKPIPPPVLVSEN